VRYSRLKTEGFLAEYRMEFAGEIDGKNWRNFRTKFLRRHTQSWNVRKTTQKHWQKTKTVVTFWCGDPEGVLARIDWEFFKATLCLFVKNPNSPG